MILRVRFRDAVVVQGLPGVFTSITSDEASITSEPDALVIHPHGRPTQVTRVSVTGNVSWLHEGPDPAKPIQGHADDFAALVKPAKKPKPKK